MADDGHDHPGPGSHGDPDPRGAREHHHGHDHGHRHDHRHDHDHSHDHQPRTEARGALERGAGVGKLLFFDCFSGVAGDMTIAALLDLGIPFEVVQQAVASLPLDGYQLVTKRVVHSGIVAQHFDVQVAAGQPQRSYGAIDDMLAEAPLDPASSRLARAIFRRLGEAEAHVHQLPLREVHFHEVGAVDAIVDVVGAAVAISYLGAEVVVSPLPLGRGFVKAQHGVLPLPAPATLQCLRGAPTEQVPLDVELVTPTGAAIVSTIATDYSRWPAMTPTQVGYGAGTRNLPDRPNLLRLVLGEPAGESSSHELIEANVDDMTGELAGHTLATLLAAGARDAWATPITMKKGRPGLTISVLAARDRAATLADLLLRETTSIGVRTTPLRRIERPRKIVQVATRYGTLPVKVSEGPHGPPQIKPELDACAEAAAGHSVPLRQVLQEVLAAYLTAHPDDL